MTRVLLHAHSTYSEDGKLTLAELKEGAEQRQFDYVLLSDHYEHLTSASYNSLVQEVDKLNSQGGCIIVPGYERSWGGYHICAYNVRSFSKSVKFNSWVHEIHSEGGIVIQAHLVKYDFNIPKFILDDVDGIEIWNSKWPYDWKFFPDPMYKKCLSKSHLLLVGQDVHKSSDFTNLGILLESNSNTSFDVIKQIKKGKFSIVPFEPKRKQESTYYDGLFSFANKVRLKLFLLAYDLKKKLS